MYFGAQGEKCHPSAFIAVPTTEKKVISELKGGIGAQKLTILPLGRVECFRRVRVDDEGGEVVDQRLVSAGITRAENVCEAMPGQHPESADCKGGAHSAHISQATCVSGVMPSKMDGRSGVIQSQTFFCCCRGQCLLPRSMPVHDARERRGQGNGLVECHAPPMSSPAARCLWRSALSAIKPSRIGRTNSHGASPKIWNSDLTTVMPARAENQRMPAGDFRRERRALSAAR